MAMNHNCLRELHPTVAVLVWLTATGRLLPEDQDLSAELMQSPDFEKLDGVSAQFVQILDGANLSEITREAAIDYMTPFMPKVDCHERVQSHT